ncbi:hypothetical protein CHARACLAT_028650 [Characodon lateralis]|uniref:Uncharacterized protein n=1 Tax=Characodon lateralis TaxID=208331 RepID=A0ABU7DBI9_9TELE|nr:hypothetical protein [Characodon lateralis]
MAGQASLQEAQVLPTQDHSCQSVQSCSMEGKAERKERRKEYCERLIIGSEFVLCSHPISTTSLNFLQRQQIFRLDHYL